MLKQTVRAVERATRDDRAVYLKVFAFSLLQEEVLAGLFRDDAHPDVERDGWEELRDDLLTLAGPRNREVSREILKIR